MSALVPAGEKHALLIGIDRYPNLKEFQQLKGCVNDALQLESVLKDLFGFPSAGITLLKNEEATREEILASLQHLARRAGPGDVVVVGYSGHGSRTRTADDSTGWDETIVPCDSGRGTDPNRDILDDEIHEWLLKMAEVTPNITLVFDSCFSAGIVRDSFEGGIRQAPPDDRPAPGTRRLRSTARESSGWRALGDRYTLIAGCRFNESAREIHLEQGGGKALYHGALTYFLCEEIRKAGREASSRDIFERAAAKVTAAFPGQHPLLEGVRDREPFGPRIFDTMRFLPIRCRQDSRAVLSGGAAHGLTVGSQWAVYAQGTHEVTPETPRLGCLKVLSVQSVTAEAAIGEEAGPRLLEPGDRAVEIEHDYGEMRLVAEVCGPDSVTEALEALRRVMKASRLLRPAEPGERGSVRVYLVPPRIEVGDGDPAPRLGAVQSPLWAVIGPDGSLLAPILRIEEEGSLKRLIENLEVRARHHLTLRIENHDPDSRLRDKIEVRLLRRKSREWVPAEPDGGGLITFQDREPFDLQIVNRSRQPVFIHILDLGLSGRIELLYPVEGALDRLQPGHIFRVSEKRGENFHFFIPEALPFDNPGGKVEGIQQLKVLATVAEADFSLLIQDGVRYLASEQGARPFKSPLERLLTAAVVGKGSDENGRRETGPVQTSLEDDWMAVTQAVLIER